jgi:zeaxanthin glucosyltransferase
MLEPALSPTTFADGGEGASARSLRLAILCPEVAGHMNPFLTLMHELRGRGHRLLFVGKLDAERKVREAGFDFVPVGEAEFPPGSWERSFHRLGELSGRAALRYTIDRYRQTAAVLLRDAPPQMARFEPDGLIVDQTLTPGATVAELLGRPFVTVCAALPLNESVHRPPAVTGWRYADGVWARLRNRIGNFAFRVASGSIRSVINDFRRSCNLKPQDTAGETFSPWAQIAPIPEEFDFPFPDRPECFHYVGPLHSRESRPATPFPFERLTGEPLIYASLGTLQNRLRHVFATIAAACEGLPAQLVLSQGGSDGDPAAVYPANAVVARFAPQLELLARAAVAITHAGMNTTAEALTRGVPLVAIPITNDQPGVAARIKRSGTGMALPLSKLTVERLRDAVVRVLTDERYRRRAAEMQRAFETAGGARRAAEIVETAIGTRQPVRALRTI